MLSRSDRYSGSVSKWAGANGSGNWVGMGDLDASFGASMGESSPFEASPETKVPENRMKFAKRFGGHHGFAKLET